jgi:hypothetical protein
MEYQDSAMPRAEFDLSFTWKNNWREFGPATFWHLGALLVGYMDYEQLDHRGAVFLPIFLYALMIVCCGFVYQAYQELLNNRKAHPQATQAISRAVGAHMIVFGLIFLSTVLLAVFQQWDGTLNPLLGLGRGRLVGHAGILGGAWIAAGVGRRR